MEEYSERDLQYAAEFREGVHKEALAKIRKTHPEIDAVVDRYPVEAYFQQHWDYPGKWYTIVAIPEGFASRDALIDVIVRDTLNGCDNGRNAAQRTRADDAEQNSAAQTRQETDAAFSQARYADDPFYAWIAAYPDCALDYCILTGDPLGHRGCASHWQALDMACRKLFAGDGDNEGWRYDINRARGKRIDTEAAFTSAYPKDKLNYRKAFLYPPHENKYTGVDFVKTNAVLFPNGTDGLEIYEWTTDWSAYFDDGHEWWGALCLTVYDKMQDRYVVILASETD